MNFNRATEGGLADIGRHLQLTAKAIETAPFSLPGSLHAFLLYDGHHSSMDIVIMQNAPGGCRRHQVAEDGAQFRSVIDEDCATTL